LLEYSNDVSHALELVNTSKSQNKAPDLLKGWKSIVPDVVDEDRRSVGHVAAPVVPDSRS